MSTNTLSKARRTAGVSYRCSECRQTSAKWFGRCPDCHTWGAMSEVTEAPGQTGPYAPVTGAAQRISDVDVDVARARPTGIAEFDRVLGGGLVPGAVVLFAGEPGVGKSTLLLDVAHRWASAASPALIVSGEESAGQLRLRAGRTQALNPHLYVAAETDLGALLAHVDHVAPTLLVVDSIQTMAHADIDGSAGGVAQVRGCTAALVRLAKQRGMATVLVGHVTKDGAVAGPRTAEHLVDVVLQFEGERHAALRLVRAVKNRFGPADEVGCFEMCDDGIREVRDPSGLFLSGHPVPVSGTCLTVSLDGSRPLLCEVQALVGGEDASMPRRQTSGLDFARSAMVLAVLDSRTSIKTGKRDVYLATVGGVRLSEPAADLATALAVGSAASQRPLPSGLVAIGEVGLAGEIRRVRGVRRRLEEAARLGCTHAYVPAGGDITAPPGMRVRPVADIREVMPSLRP